LEHIKAFNNFFENDESQKIGAEAFTDSFDRLIKNVSQYGFKEDMLIPVANNILLDGAHRTALAIYLNKEINTVDLEIEAPNYNYEFFKNRGLSEIYLDYMATQYLELKDNVYMILLWPSSGGGKEKELKNILDKYGKVIYRKEIKLKNLGPVNLIRQVYKKEKWVGSTKDGYIGAYNKAKWCFDKNTPLRVILFESDKDMVKMKDEIRNLYKVGKHSVHINDTKEEALELVGLLFNENSIHWLNNAFLKDMPKFNKLFKIYKKELLNKDNYLIVGGILAVYGIKDANDLDFICVKNENINFNNKLIEQEKSKIQFTNKSVDDLIFNPKNYFKINGVKLLTLSEIKNIKEKRKKGKDVEDILIINKLLKEERIIKVNLKDKIKFLINFGYLKGKIKFILLKIRFYITKIILEKKR